MTAGWSESGSGRSGKDKLFNFRTWRFMIGKSVPCIMERWCKRVNHGSLKSEVNSKGASYRRHGWPQAAYRRRERVFGSVIFKDDNFKEYIVGLRTNSGIPLRLELAWCLPRSSCWEKRKEKQATGFRPDGFLEATKPGDKCSEDRL